jgi:hypothetical protein
MTVRLSSGSWPAVRATRLRSLAGPTLLFLLLATLPLPSLAGARQRLKTAAEPAAAAGPAAGAAMVTFRKVFKSSSPEYIEIKVDEQGRGSYDIRQLDESPNPRPFTVGPALVQRIFELAAKLHDFQNERLNLRRRIAYLGEKTFRYESGGQSYETSFNYTTNPTANQLLDLFEDLALQQHFAQRLERTMRYDHLGLNDVLLELEADISRKLIPEPNRLLPLLDQIAANPEYLNIARERARGLATRIRTVY